MRGDSCGASGRGGILSALALLLAISVVSSSVSAVDFEPIISVTPAQDHVMIMSGNLTAYLMSDWPRIVFRHSNARLSPSFDFGIHSIRVYELDVSQVVSEQRVHGPDLVAPVELLDWRFEIYEIDFSEAHGQQVRARMNATIDLYDTMVLTSEFSQFLTPVIWNWGEVSIDFALFQRGSLPEQMHPTLTVRDYHRVDLSITFTVREGTDFRAVGIAEIFQGGGPTYMARIYHSVLSGSIHSEEISTRVNEASDDPNCFHPISAGQSDWQLASLTTTTGAEQAFCSWNRSIGLLSDGEEIVGSTIVTYRTSGTSLDLVTIIGLDEMTESMTILQSVGIIDEGFNQPVKDLLLDFMPYLIGLCVIIPAILLSYRFARIRREARVTIPPEERDEDRQGLIPK